MRSIDRRYYIEFVPAMLAYSLIMLFVWRHVLTIESTALRALGALLPVLPTLMVVRAIYRRIVAGDEFERQVALQALAISTMVVGIVSFAVAFMVIANVVNPGADILIWVLPALMGCYGLARFALLAGYARP